VEGRATNCGCTYRDSRGRPPVPSKPYRDLTGQQLQQYLVLGRDLTRRGRGHTWWRARCACGRETTHDGHLLVSGRDTQCGRCAQRHRAAVVLHRWYGDYFVLARVANAPDRAPRYQCRCYFCGQLRVLRRERLHAQARCRCHHTRAVGALLQTRVGRWEVLEVAGSTRNGDPLYRCRCTCPAQTVRLVRRSRLLGGKSSSCGCGPRGRRACDGVLDADPDVQVLEHAQAGEE
jgi:hypothetical protein